MKENRGERREKRIEVGIQTGRKRGGGKGRREGRGREEKRGRGGGRRDGDGRRGECLPTGSWQWGFPQRLKYEPPSSPWLSLAYGPRASFYRPSYHIPSIVLNTHKCPLLKSQGL